MSSKRRGGLGRGLGALIPTAPPEEATDPSTQQPPAGEGADGRPPGDQHVPQASDDGADLDPFRADAVDLPQADVVDTWQGDALRGAPELAPVPGAAFLQVAVGDVVPNSKQPRQVFDEDALAELAHSIREFGMLQPIVVRAVEAPADGTQPDQTQVDGPAGVRAARYELVMGERRWRAAAVAGLDTVPAIVRSTADDAMLRDALLENIHRAQLNPLEEAAAYQQLLDEFGTTHDELARRIGRSRPQVSNTIRLLQLPLAVQRRVAAGVLSAGHARALLGLESRDQQDELAARIVAEGLSVRATEELVSLAQRGGMPSKVARSRTPNRITAPAVAELAADLSDVFDTRVRVDLGRRKGRITVEFASIDDLERIVGVMAPQIAATRRGEPERGVAATQAGESGAGESGADDSAGDSGGDAGGDSVANEP